MVLPSFLPAIARLRCQCGQGGGNPNQLWKTDGTAAGTVEVKQFTNFEGPKYVGTNSSGKPIVLTVGRNKLWESDGTPAGTQPMPGGIYGDYVTPVVVGPHPLAFFVGLGTGGYQLWSTDGSVGRNKETGGRVALVPHVRHFGWKAGCHLRRRIIADW